ncbi:putative VIER F-box protein 1 [Asimina triloba]
MGQSLSTSSHPSGTNRGRSMKTTRSTPSISSVLTLGHQITDDFSSSSSSSFEDLITLGDRDFSADLPDECLAHVFHWLCSGDRKRCSLVCRRWLRVEGQSRHRLSLDAHSELISAIPALFSRFDSISKLALKCDRRAVSIGDEALGLISLRCRGLTRLKLRTCREITDAGLADFARNCRSLKKLSCGSCCFGAKGINAVLQFCPEFEELSLKHLRGLSDGSAAEPIGPGAASSSLKTICLKGLYNGQCFGPLIVGSKSLKSLKLIHCSGEWDVLLQVIAERISGLKEIHLERIQVSDRGLCAISNCAELEILHLVKSTECTNAGLVSVAERCKLLRKLHIDGWKMNRIGDEGLIAVAKRCPNLQELVLIGVNPTTSSIGLLASNCQNLERLALCTSETIGDAEISCIAEKCVALRKLCIKGCPVSDQGMEALANGCPNLVKVKVKKCRGVTCEGADWLRANRGSVAVNLDTDMVEQLDASDAGAVVEYRGEPLPPIADRSIAADLQSSSSSRSALSRARMRLSAGRNFMAFTFRRLSLTSSNFPSSI